MQIIQRLPGASKTHDQVGFIWPMEKKKILVLNPIDNQVVE